MADERRHARPDPARALASPAALRAALAAVANRRALAVLLVDLTDVAGSFLSRVRDLVGRNPVLLLGTKARHLLCHSLCLCQTHGAQQQLLSAACAAWPGAALWRSWAPRHVARLGRVSRTTSHKESQAASPVQPVQWVGGAVQTKLAVKYVGAVQRALEG